jgi:hypothetical protein
VETRTSALHSDITMRVVLPSSSSTVAPLPANDDEFAVMFLFLLRVWHPRGCTVGADKAQPVGGQAGVRGEIAKLVLNPRGARYRGLGRSPSPEKSRRLACRSRPGPHPPRPRAV